MKTIHIIILFFLPASLLVSCKKDWLDAKSNKALVIPTTLKDLQALLDNSTVFNLYQPGIGELGSGDFYMQYDVWKTMPIEEKNAYMWAPDIYEGVQEEGNWGKLYQKVFYANVVLEGIKKIDFASGSQAAWNNI